MPILGNPIGNDRVDVRVYRFVPLLPPPEPSGDNSTQQLLSNLPKAGPLPQVPPKPKEEGELVIDDGC